MPDFSTRSQQIEIMDDLNCSGEVVYRTLRELETINLLLGGNYVTLNGINQLLADHPKDRQLTIADLGCGGGDILRIIHKLLRDKGLQAKLIGIDANPHIIEYARKNTPSETGITYEVIDIFSSEFAARKFDIVIGTLFFHHFSSPDLSIFFKKLQGQVTRGIVINDIHRHWFAFHSIRWLTRIFSKSAMVRFDAPLSVLRAFRKSELLDILANAGIVCYGVRWMWAFRWQVIIRPK